MTIQSPAPKIGATIIGVTAVLGPFVALPTPTLLALGVGLIIAPAVLPAAAMLVPRLLRSVFILVLFPFLVLLVGTGVYQPEPHEGPLTVLHRRQGIDPDQFVTSPDDLDLDTAPLTDPPDDQ